MKALVIWPKQQVVIASAVQVAQGGQAIPEAAAGARRASLASRTNTLFSIPMLFFMGAAHHYPSIGRASGLAAAFWIVSLVIIAAVEINCLIGTQDVAKKPLDSVSGTLWSGFILTLVLFLVFKILL